MEQMDESDKGTNGAPTDDTEHMPNLDLNVIIILYVIVCTHTQTCPQHRVLSVLFGLEGKLSPLEITTIAQCEQV